MKRILITGASSGVGLALARHFHQAGDQVVGIARDFSGLADNFSKVECDLSDLDHLPETLATDPALKQCFDTMILNAGAGRFGGLEQFSFTQIQQLINLNLVSNLFITKHYLSDFKAQGNKDIFVIGSESALRGAKQGTLYCASKFALRGFVQSLRADTSTTNVRVMLVNPGPVNTGFFDQLNFEPVDGNEFVIEPESVVKAIVNALEQPRNVVTEEINMQPMKRSFVKKQ